MNRKYGRIILLAISLLSGLFWTVGIMAQKAKAPTFAKGYGYLFCHMSQSGEYTAFALSRDGVNFQELLGGDPVYDPRQLSRIEGGSRDAFIARAGNGKGYVMAVTDMSNHKTHSWNNYGIDLLKSDDLIHWNSVSFDFRKGPDIFSDPGSADFYKDYSGICRVWAPQVIWDADYQWPNGAKGGYMIYYSLLNSREDKYDRVFYSYGDASFTTMTKPRLLIDWQYATIDADIHFVAADGKFHLLIKKEGGTPGIYTATAKNMTGPYSLPNDTDYIDFEGNRKVEGPCAFQLIGDSSWRVAYVEYASRPAKYRICLADKFLQQFHSPRDIGGDAATTAQHGSFLILNKREYKKLERWSADYLKHKLKLKQKSPFLQK